MSDNGEGGAQFLIWKMIKAVLWNHVKYDLCMELIKIYWSCLVILYTMYSGCTCVCVHVTDESVTLCPSVSVWGELCRRQRLGVSVSGGRLKLLRELDAEHLEASCSGVSGLKLVERYHLLPSHAHWLVDAQHGR